MKGVDQSDRPDLSGDLKSVFSRPFEPELARSLCLPLYLG